MLPVLDTAISGMRVHQERLDVIGSNIANVNTTGFKQGRQTFSEALAQTLAGATRPDGHRGGINPLQIGTGVQVSSVDTLFSQGNFQATGQVTDMAIDGGAFFQVTDGDDTYYTRNGAFALDAEGQLVMPESGFILQGRPADPDGTISGGTPIGSITIPIDTQAPAQATTEVKLGRNLDADGEARGTILSSEPFLKYAIGAEPLEALLDSTGQPMGLTAETTLTFSVTSEGIDYTTRYKIATGDTYATLRQRLNTFIRAVDPASRFEFQAHPNVQTMGALTVVYGTKTLENLAVTSDRAPYSSQVATAFRFPPLIDRSGLSPANYSCEPLRIGTKPQHLLRDTYNAQGIPFAKSLETGDQISVSAMINGEHVGGTRTLTYNPATTTMQNVLDLLQDELGLAPSIGPVKSTRIDAQGSQNNIADGSIVLQSLPGMAFSMADVQLTATNANSRDPKPLSFNDNSVFHEIQAARDAAVVDTTISIYDDQGASHDLTIAFTHSDNRDEWIWNARTGADERIIAGSGGRIKFGPDGTVASFYFSDGAAALQIDPGHGAGILNVKLDPGESGNFNGLTQLRSASTAAALAQDGHTSGVLKSIEVGQDGLITGLFTSGTRQSLAQIVVAEFSNPGGLAHQGGSVFQRSANSGDPIQGVPGRESSSTIKAGALEMSNVDLADQFTSMITSQRGYQANARVLTQSDRFLEELVNLAR